MGYLGIDFATVNVSESFTRIITNNYYFRSIIAAVAAAE